MAFGLKTDLPKVYESYDFIAPSKYAGKLKGKTVVVTGASAGTGRVTCVALAAAGASVACVARRKDRLDALVEEINTKAVGKAFAIEADVADATAPERIVEVVEKELGLIDVLINNAGIQRMGPFVGEDDFDQWWRVFEVNVRAPAALAHAVLPSMIKRKAGIIINVSSLAGVLNVPIMTPYNASKAALIKFSTNLAQEVEKDGILCFSVHPGLVQSEITTLPSAVSPAGLQDPVLAELVNAASELKRQSPDIMADVCVALCADERYKVLNGRFIDMEQSIEEVLKEAEKPGLGKIGEKDLYRLKLEGL